MESNGYEHQLFEAVRAVATIALKAYWTDRDDCGSEMGDQCLDCQHYQVCAANAEMQKALGTLESWNC